VIDWHMRRVLSWRLSVTMGARFGIAAVEGAVAKYGKPAIMNTD